MTVYTPLGGAQGATRRPSGPHRQAAGRAQAHGAAAPRANAAAAAAAELARAQKAEELGALSNALERLHSLHREEFRPATRPVAPPPAVPAFSEVLAFHEKRALKGVGIFERARRAEMRAGARRVAMQEHQGLVRDAEAAQSAFQKELDAWWGRLLDGKPEETLAVLVEAFEDNEAPAAAVGVEANAASIVVLVPGKEVVPDRELSVTAAGSLTSKKASQTAVNSLYLQLVAAHLLITAKEAFAVAPGVERVRMVGVRKGFPDIYGKTEAEPLVAVEFTRESLTGVRWAEVSGIDVLFGAGQALRMNLQGRTREVCPLTVAGDEGLQAAADVFDFDESA